MSRITRFDVEDLKEYYGLEFEEKIEELENKKNKRKYMTFNKIEKIVNEINKLYDGKYKITKKIFNKIKNINDFKKVWDVMFYYFEFERCDHLRLLLEDNIIIYYNIWRDEEKIDIYMENLIIKGSKYMHLFVDDIDLKNKKIVKLLIKHVPEKIWLWMNHDRMGDKLSEYLKYFLKSDVLRYNFNSWFNKKYIKHYNEECLMMLLAYYPNKFNIIWDEKIILNSNIKNYFNIILDILHRHYKEYENIWKKTLIKYKLLNK